MICAMVSQVQITHSDNDYNITWDNRMVWLYGISGSSANQLQIYYNKSLQDLLKFRLIQKGSSDRSDT